MEHFDNENIQACDNISFIEALTAYLFYGHKWFSKKTASEISAEASSYEEDEDEDEDDEEAQQDDITYERFLAHFTMRGSVDVQPEDDLCDGWIDTVPNYVDIDNKEDALEVLARYRKYDPCIEVFEFDEDTYGWNVSFKDEEETYHIDIHDLKLSTAIYKACMLLEVNVLGNHSEEKIMQWFGCILDE